MWTWSRLVAAPAIGIAAVVCLSTAATRVAAVSSVSEYDVKATFLFNFLKFASWPPSALAPGAPIEVCILGDSAIASSLEVFRGQLVDGHRLEVRPVVDPYDLRFCHAAFIGEREGHRAATALTTLDGASVLTIGEQDDFLDRGGIINFISESSRIRFDINQEAAERVKVKISAHLLRLARKTGGGRLS